MYQVGNTKLFLRAGQVNSFPLVRSFSMENCNQRKVLTEIFLKNRLADWKNAARKPLKASYASRSFIGDTKLGAVIKRLDGQSLFYNLVCLTIQFYDLYAKCLKIVILKQSLFYSVVQGSGVEK